MQVMTARHFGALKMALWKLSTTYSGSISAILDKTFYLSWSHYTDSFNDVQQFECDKIQKPSKQLFFFSGVRWNDILVCIKCIAFVPARDVHRIFIVNIVFNEAGRFMLYELGRSTRCGTL